MTISFIDLHIM